MEKKIISFKGISNVPDDGLNEAGDMSVLLNMRHKGGELVPCQKPAVDSSLAMPIKQALYHSSSDFWLVLNQTGILQEWSKSLNKRIYVENVSSFSIMGNMVIINFEDKVEYAIWREGKYVYLGGVPEVPRLVVKSITNAKQTYLTDSKLDDNVDSGTYHWKFQKGNIDKTLAMIYSQKGYVDRAWFRVAVKMFDGSYINIGEIVELSCFPNAREKNEYGVVTQPIIGAQKIWQNISTGEYKTELDYFVPELGVVSNMGNWNDVIASIDLFTTGSIMSHTAGLLTKDDDPDAPPGIEIYKLRTAEQLKEALLNAEFYKIAEFAVDGSVITGTEIENTSPSNLAVRDTLKDISTHSVIPNNALAYNARLHTYGYKEVYFKGYGSATSYYDGLTQKDNAWTVFVHIKTDNGTVIVERKDQILTNGNPKNAFKHLYYFYYPDRNAFKMEIYDNGKVLSLPLTAHPYRNEAYNLMTTTVNVVLDEHDPEKEYSIEHLPVIAGEEYGGWKDMNSMPTVTNIVEKKDTLKVSAVDNPFYFPTAQTYKFEGDIVGLASNAEAISPGQFGQFPLYVFTKEGVWAMPVDTSGQGAYLSQSPFSREVCDGAVCPVSGGVVFTTKRGVMAISGGQVADLSAMLDGFEVDSFKYNAEMWNAIFAKAGKGVVNPVPIREYIQAESGAKLAYNYLHNEVILSNVNYGYSYVYSLDSQTWGMIDTKFDITTNSYPELVVYNSQEGKMYTFDDSSTENVPIVAITRPFTLGSFDFKRLRQAGLRTTFEGSLNFYLLGSNDGANFVCITGKECPTKSEVESGITSVSTQRDLITAMSRSKQYKYFAIAIAGNMSGRVSMAELLVDAGFAVNKLR